MLARVVAALAFIVIAGIAFWYGLVLTVHRGTLAVPDLRGETLEQAERIAHDLGVSVTVDQAGLFSVATPAGAIADQDPPPGFHVKVGSTVSVRLSLGSERVRIPDIRGESLQGALRGLEQQGLSPGRRVEIDGQSGADHIIATDPPIGRGVAPDSSVDLLVNVAPSDDLWVMPSLLSEARDVVRRWCLQHQLRLGQVHEVVYPGLPSGVVLRQYPAAGSPLSRSDIITIWVSR